MSLRSRTSHFEFRNGFVVIVAKFCGHGFRVWVVRLAVHVELSKHAFGYHFGPDFCVRVFLIAHIGI